MSLSVYFDNLSEYPPIVRGITKIKDLAFTKSLLIFRQQYEPLVVTLHRSVHIHGTVLL